MPALCGVLLALVAPATARSSADDHFLRDDLSYNGDLPSFQVAFVFYEAGRFKEFQERALSARTVEDWEKDNENFVVCAHLPCRPRGD